MHKFFIMKRISTLILAVILLSFAKLTGQISLIIEQPSNLAGPLGFTNATDWGGSLATATITSQVVLGRDASVEDTLGCLDFANASEVAGKIAMVYRGTCQFSMKALRAQNAGAIAIIIVNNVPGNPIPMGGGDNSASITIPVVMISQADGALIRPLVDSGELVVFLGNKTGLFPNDLSVSKADVVTPNSFATPSSLIQNAQSFSVPLGSWVFNRGNQPQENVVLNAKITKGAQTLYDETSAFGASILPGDSLYITLPVFAPNAVEQGFYTLTYTTNSDNTDNFIGDNEVIRNFTITQDKYSKSRLDETGQPLGTSGLRPAEGAQYTWCISLSSPSASGVKAKGMTFSTVTSGTKDLTGETVQLELFKWDDDISSSFTFNILDPLTEAFYDYPSNLQEEFITVDFDNEIALESDQKYLACATIFRDSIFLRIDNELDYTGNDGVYELPPFPLRSTQWFAGGFGLENVPALVLNLSGAANINDVKNTQLTAFPNPSPGLITIPFKGAVKGAVRVEMYSTAGQLVLSEQSQLANNQIQVDATALSAGLYQVALQFADGSRSNIKVLISK